MSFESNGLDPWTLHEAFASTEHGQRLAANVRYGHFKPEGVTNERWIELLGPDVNNLTHLADTYGLACNFISHTDRLQPGLLGAREKAVLGVGAIIHDWGESLEDIGDINYTLKTAEDEEREEKAFADNLSKFLGSDSSEELAELVREATDTVIFNKRSRLGSAFNTIERIGYLRTALRANEHVLAGSAPDCHEALRWLVVDVLANHHTSHVIAASTKWLAAHHFLDFQRYGISEAFEASDPAIFDENIADPYLVLERRVAFEDANELWAYWAGVQAT